MKHYCVIATAPGPGEGGGMSIYLQLMDALRHSMEEGVCDETWHVFIDEGMPMPQMPHVRYYQYHTKGFQRVWFDFVAFRRILKEEGVRPDVIVSLQNTGVRCRCERSVIYYHQSLPLYSYHYRGFGRYARTYYFYHYLYPLYVRLFLQKNTFVAVQTEAIKKAFSDKYRFPLHKMGVYMPSIKGVEKKDIDDWRYEAGTYNFLFPANPSPYKEHMTIAYALKQIYLSNVDLARQIRIHFTAQRGSMKNLEQYIVENGMDSNFVFHGIVPHSQLVAMLNNSHGLLFPSLIETLGLPLIEAASLGVAVIVNRLEYAHEALGGYEGTTYVDVHDYEAWARIIMSCCERKERFTPYRLPKNDSWERFLSLIREGVCHERRTS